ncbi:hypothetical protein [Halobacillus locisalis]|nr:hypothetical protein [Halobacillus locisalis]
MFPRTIVIRYNKKGMLKEENYTKIAERSYLSYDYFIKQKVV